MRFATLACLSLMVACGGSEPATPAPEPAPAPAPEPEPEPEPANDDGPSKDADISGMSDDEKKDFLMALGEKVYKTGDGGLACNTCHGDDGKGTPGAFPPLVGQKEHMGDCKKHAGLVINGLQGELVVDGTTYNGVMTPQGDMLNDLQIAAVITYERLSWGNDYGVCLPADVAAAR